MDQEKTPSFPGENAQDGFLEDDAREYSPGPTALLTQETPPNSARYVAEIRDADNPIRTTCSDYPDGGLRAWLVVLGCVLFSANTLGWAYVRAEHLHSALVALT